MMNVIQVGSGRYQRSDRGQKMSQLSYKIKWRDGRLLKTTLEIRGKIIIRNRNQKTGNRCFTFTLAQIKITKAE